MERRQASSNSRNAVAQTLALSAGYAGSFLSAPIVLSGLGLRAYGVWALTGGLAQYGSLLDLGLGRAVSTFVAGYDSQGDVRAIGEAMTIGLLGSIVIAVPLAALAFFLAAPVAAAIGGIGTTEMRILLLCGAGMTSLAMLSRAVGAWPVGLRRMLAPNIGAAIGSGLNFVLSVGVILLGGKLVAYAVANLCASVLGFVVIIAVVLATEGVPPMAWPSLARWRMVFRFALQGQVVYLCDLVNYQSDKIIIGLTAGPPIAGAYNIANQVCSAARAVGVFAQSALLPAFAAQVAEEGHGILRRSYGPMTLRTSSVAFPGLFLCAGAAPLVLAVWLGRIPPDGAAVLFVLSLGYVANVSTGVGYAVAAAGGAIRIPARAASATAVVNIGLTAALAPIFGVWGVLAGTFGALTAGAVLQVALIQQRFSIPQGTHWRAIRGSMAIAGGLAIPVGIASLAASYDAERGVQAVVLGVCALGYGLVYCRLAASRDLLPPSLLPILRKVRMVPDKG